jgi:hypothetical protein
MTQTPTTFGLRMPPQMQRWIAERAKRNRRSINGEIVHLLGCVHDNDEREAADHGQS